MIRSVIDLTVNESRRGLQSLERSASVGRACSRSQSESAMYRCASANASRIVSILARKTDRHHHDCKLKQTAGRISVCCAGGGAYMVCSSCGELCPIPATSYLPEARSLKSPNRQCSPDSSDGISDGISQLVRLTPPGCSARSAPPGLGRWAGSPTPPPVRTILSEMQHRKRSPDPPAFNARVHVHDCAQDLKLQTRFFLRCNAKFEAQGSEMGVGVTPR